MTTVAQSLYDRGVRTIFGLPGGEVFEILDAFINPDYALITASYRLGYHYVNSIESCQIAIQSALLAKKPYLIDV
jgi:thiamine pyrophosphate-dependent acetolactate synthase large subunit-like protein